MTKTFSVYRSSAGSGKTRTLAKAYLRLALQYRVDYFRHILAVTFTNKASQEMKDRILEYIDAFARGQGGSLAEELQAELRMDPQTFRQNSQEVQSTLLHKYNHFAISTIDAFFQKVIRSFIREAGLVGDYRLEVDQDAVLEDVIDNLVDELGSNKELTEWVVEFAKENLENERAWDVRFSLIEFAREIFREEFKEIEDVVNKTTSQKNYFRDLRDQLSTVRQAFLTNVSFPARECLDAIRQSGYTIDDFKYGKSSGLLSFLEQCAAAKTVSKCKPAGLRVRNEFTTAENWPGKKCADPAGIVALARNTLVPRIEAMLAAFEENHCAALSAEVALQNMYVFGLITDISRKLKEYKDENNLMLLADAPKFLNGVIRDSDTPFIYEKVGSFFRNFLIDEFQDTSGLQWQNFQPLIVNSLDQGYHSLVVGDVKQAIYRWRGGDLKLLQEKIVPLVGEESADVKELDNNFRSDSGIVNFNNAVFRNAARILAREVGVTAAGGAYADVIQKTSSTAEGFVDIRFIPDEKDEENPDGNRSWKDLAMEGLPKILEGLQEKGVPLKDIAILVRKNDEGQKIAAFLLQYKNSPEARTDCSYDVVSNESLRIDGAASVNLLLGAMRYLLNTEDSIARAQLAYEFARLHEPGRMLAEVFMVTNQAIFENNLPPAFTKAKTFLKKLPLIELTETLIDIFNLGAVTGELVYLQTFQDLVLEFTNRERNDLGAFLEWWEVNRNKKSIQISGEVNAVQILTIHKSKGLQFRYVIIPFCAWSLDHESWQAPNLWVQSTEGPFAGAGYLPVKYSSTLRDTFFSGFYEEERTRIALDNLNLLYVAFTRAESGLIVTAPCIENRGAKNSIAGLLYRSMEGDELKDQWDAERLAWRKGSMVAPRPGEGKHVDAIQLSDYLASPWRDKLVIRQMGATWFRESLDAQREKVNYGIQMHAVLSRLHYGDELPETLSRIVNEGLITAGTRESIEAQLAELLKNDQIAGWFTREWEVRTEVPILLPDGQENRIDRLLTQGKKAIVVDFKTGTHKKSDEQQVLQYIDILRKMNYPEVNGYLLYLGKNEVIEVKSGGRPKVVAKAKDRDQLDLF